MVIKLESYKQNKEIYRNLRFINSFFAENYADKTWAWVCLTALLYSQLALENYLENNNPDPKFIPAMKSVLWQFMNVLNVETEAKKKG